MLVEETGVIYGGEAARPKRRKPRTCDRVAIGVAVASLLGFAAVRLAPSTKPATNYAAQINRETLQWRATNDYVETLGVIGADYAWTSEDTSKSLMPGGPSNSTSTATRRARSSGL